QALHFWGAVSETVDLPKEGAVGKPSRRRHRAEVSLSRGKLLGITSNAQQGCGHRYRHRCIDGGEGIERLLKGPQCKMGPDLIRLHEEEKHFSNSLRPNSTAFCLEQHTVLDTVNGSLRSVLRWRDRNAPNVPQIPAPWQLRWRGERQSGLAS